MVFNWKPTNPLNLDCMVLNWKPTNPLNLDCMVLKLETNQPFKFRLFGFKIGDQPTL